MVDPSCGRLWAAPALTTLTILTARALGRAVHSAGLDGPLTWPNGRDFVTTRDTLPHQLAAQRTRASRLPLHVTHDTRVHASGDGNRTDDECDRLSPLGPSNSVVAELAVTVEAAINHYVKGVRNSCS